MVSRGLAAILLLIGVGIGGSLGWYLRDGKARYEAGFQFLKDLQKEREHRNTGNSVGDPWV